jgi:hypothetical protein
MPKLPDPAGLGSFLTDRFGVALTVTAGEDGEGPYYDIRPADLHENEGFAVRAVIGWRSVVAKLHIGKFAGDLLRDVAAATPEQRSAFASVATALAGQGARIRMGIGGYPASPLDPQSWPESWTTFDLEVDRTPLPIDHENAHQLHDAVVTWAGGLLGMLVCLLPLEDITPVISLACPKGQGSGSRSTATNAAA